MSYPNCSKCGRSAQAHNVYDGITDHYYRAPDPDFPGLMICWAGPRCTEPLPPGAVDRGPAVVARWKAGRR